MQVTCSFLCSIAFLEVRISLSDCDLQKLVGCLVVIIEDGDLLLISEDKPCKIQVVDRFLI